MPALESIFWNKNHSLCISSNLLVIFLASNVKTAFDSERPHTECLIAQEFIYDFSIRTNIESLEFCPMRVENNAKY